MSHTSPTAGPATSTRSGVYASVTSRSMAIPLRSIALVYRVIALALIVTGIVRITGLFSGEPVWNSLLFYTVQSNVLCLVWMAVLIWATVRDLAQRGGRGFSTPSPRVGGAVMMAITVTMLVYLIVLVPASFVQNSNYEPFSFTDNLIHIITPCLILVDWALFTPKGSFRRFDPLLWALIPCAYLVFALTYGALGGEFVPGQTYAYPFLDVASHGWGGVFARVAVLAVTLIGVGYLFFALDRLLAGRRGPALPSNTGR